MFVRSIDFPLSAVVAVIIGLATFAGGIWWLGLIFLLYSAYSFYIYSNAKKENILASENNAIFHAEKEARDKVIKNWMDKCVDTAYLSSTDDIFGRFTLALSSSINQVFDDKKATLSAGEIENFTQDQINEQINKRMKDFK
jgi:cbb3-type cytochrome oxidase subunit 3